MSKQDIIRAWKDAAYRDSLSAAERAALPDNPAGAMTTRASRSKARAP
jgi:mersacidin/lichenicidin family type 2 lantibiotic